MTARSVWPISIGDYSDYQVVAVCDSEETAKAVTAHLNGHKRSRYADDYVVDQPISLYAANDALPEKRTVWSATVYPDGRVTRTSEDKWEHDISEGGGKLHMGAGHAYGYQSPEEAERHARGWMSIP